MDRPFPVFRQQRVVVNGVKSKWAPVSLVSHRAPSFAILIVYQ